MIPVVLFLAGHWYLSLFCQTFFLHRYGAHGMFKLSPFWQRFFHLLTFVSQGSSYLNPRAYAVMHRMHHAFSDTERDPHSPHHSKNIFEMMVKTYRIFRDLLQRRVDSGSFGKGIPEWPALDRLGQGWSVRIGFAAAYTSFYIAFATHWWLFLLLPLHFVMGPVQGALVNWCGHKYGYVNYRETGDRSTNTLAMDFLLMGELFQNNHHQNPRRINFARRWFEFDPGWPLIWLLNMAGIVKYSRG
jgi:stearoyl-CoA desaturase (delta-9 desaturase)